jgi:hypothetical protein
MRFTMEIAVISYVLAIVLGSICFGLVHISLKNHEAALLGTDQYSVENS